MLLAEDDAGDLRSWSAPYQPRTLSGASGLGSNVSCWPGPPHWCRKMTALARALSGLRRPRASRERQPSSRPPTRRRPAGGAVDQHDQPRTSVSRGAAPTVASGERSPGCDVAPRGAFMSSAPPGGCATASPLATHRRLRDSRPAHRRNRNSLRSPAPRPRLPTRPGGPSPPPTYASSLLRLRPPSAGGTAPPGTTPPASRRRSCPAASSLPMRLSGSRSSACTSSPVMSWNACNSPGSSLRSHSHVSSRSGLPNAFRNRVAHRRPRRRGGRSAAGPAPGPPAVPAGSP